MAIIASVVGIVYVNISNAKPANALMGGVVVSSLISAVVFWPLTKLLFVDGLVARDVLSGTERIYSAGGIYLASLIGLLMTGASVFITHYYTSTAHSPVRKIASCKRDRSCDEYHCRPGCWPARDGSASDLHCSVDLAEPQCCRTLWHCRGCHGHAGHVRDHHLSRRLRPDHGQCGRYCGHERASQIGAGDHR